MKYQSTRGGVAGLTFEQALCTGYAEDGGILLPESIPLVSRDQLISWKDLTYTELVKEILPLFVPEDEIPKDDLNALIDRAFKTFTHPEVAPIAHLKDGLNIMELFHGATWAFKDLALSCVGQFLEYFLSKRKQHQIIVVGTSGDTGSAAIAAVRGLKWVDLVVLLPRGRCSEIQELQMTTVADDNIHVFRVDGSSDDLDIPIKRLFLDLAFTRRHRLSSINSINWARVMVQTVHYIYAYLKMCPTCDGEVEVVIPTGACGNVTSGCLARKMGVPIRLVCAVTENDIVARTIRSGDFSMAPTVKQTLATAMDIQIPYNMERIWSLVTDGDTPTVKRMMLEFEATKRVTVPDSVLKKMKEVIVDTEVVSDDDVRATMAKVWKDNSYLICPHTAIGVFYHLHHSTSLPRVVIATASVKKFREAMESAGLEFPSYPDVQALYQTPRAYKDMEKGENWEQILREKIVSITESHCK